MFLRRSKRRAPKGVLASIIHYILLPLRLAFFLLAVVMRLPFTQPRIPDPPRNDEMEQVEKNR